MKHPAHIFIFSLFLLAACAPISNGSTTLNPHALAGAWTLTQTVTESNRADVAAGFSEVDDITIIVAGKRATLTTADGNTLSGMVQGENYIIADLPSKEDPNRMNAFYHLILQNGKIVGYRENVYPQGDPSKVVWDLTGVRKE
jgi:hypothetical protein